VRCCGLERESEQDERMCENPVKTFPIIKRMNFFIDRMAALYIGETQIIFGTYEGD